MGNEDIGTVSGTVVLRKEHTFTFGPPEAVAQNRSVTVSGTVFPEIEEFEKSVFDKNIVGTITQQVHDPYNGFVARTRLIADWGILDELKLLRAKAEDSDKKEEENKELRKELIRERFLRQLVTENARDMGIANRKLVEMYHELVQRVIFGGASNG
jgi:hypothetical protein